MVVSSAAGRDRLFICDRNRRCVQPLRTNGKDRRLEKPKRNNLKHVSKVLRAETRVAAKLLAGDKVLNSELRKDLAYIRQTMN